MKKLNHHRFAGVVGLVLAAGCGSESASWSPSEDDSSQKSAPPDAGPEHDPQDNQHTDAGSQGEPDEPPVADAGVDAVIGEPAACGAAHQACCAEESCVQADTVCIAGMCAPCGGNGLACCGDSCAAGLACIADRCSPCGGAEQVCCDNQQCDGPDKVCVGQTCVSCGEPGQACCDNQRCNGEHSLCVQGTCESCGEPGQACCDNEQCNGEHSLCVQGTCESCGEPGQTCCENEECNGLGQICVSGTCESCGGEGEPCCGQECEGFFQCTGGTCECAGENKACCEAARDKTSYGCDFWAVQLPKQETYQYGCFAVVLANVSSEPAHIWVNRDSAAFAVHDFATVYRYGSYVPLAPGGALAPGEIAVLSLARSAGFGVGCPSATGAVHDAAVYGTGRGHAFHIQTDQPVAAYQFTPFIDPDMFDLTSATMLLPTSVWDTSYVAVAPSETSMAVDGSLLAILAEEDNTQVTITPKADLAGSYALPGASAGTPVTYSVRAGEFIQFAQDTELTGSLVQADKPVAVWGGSKCFRIPAGTGHCEPGQQQLVPIRALGHEFVGVSHRPRLSYEDDRYYWRLVGVVDGTALSWRPAVPAGAPSRLDAGQVVTFSTLEPFVVRSQDSNHPFYAAAYMSAPQSSSEGGDTEWTNLVATANYHNKYTFLSLPNFPKNDLVVVRRPVGGVFYPSVYLDCLGELTGWTSIGDYQYTHVDLSQGFCTTGRRSMHGNGPFTVTVWGWDDYGSYAYPAGAMFPGLVR